MTIVRMILVKFCQGLSRISLTDDCWVGYFSRFYGQLHLWKCRNHERHFAEEFLIEFVVSVECEHVQQLLVIQRDLVHQFVIIERFALGFVE